MPFREHERGTVNPIQCRAGLFAVCRVAPQALLTKVKQLVGNPDQVVQINVAVALFAYGLEEDGRALLERISKSLGGHAIEIARRYVSFLPVGRTEPYSECLADLERRHDTKTARAASEVMP